MKAIARFIAVLPLLPLLAAPLAGAVTDSFGSDPFLIEFTEIGDAGNAEDTNGHGAVPYNYLIGTLEITESQFRKATENGLENARAGAWADEQPAGFVHWFEAAAFANFLNTSAGFPPAYNLEWDEAAQKWEMQPWPDSESWGRYGEKRFRHRDARYFLPTEDEWYKAAYYKGGGTNAGYWAFPLAQDTPPTAAASGTAPSTAVFEEQTQPAAAAESGGLSAYGTRGQGGNMAEWTESAWDGTNTSPYGTRVLRGGHWFAQSQALAASNREISSPLYESDMVGFRVAKVTTPPFSRRLSVSEGTTNLANHAPAESFGGFRPGVPSGTRTYTIRNTGTEPLANVVFTAGGPAISDFVIVLPEDGPLAPGESAEIDVTFEPTAGSDRTAFLNIASEDPANNPFVINLAGYGITQDFDKDGDGLNDAAEYGMSSLGFDFNIPQPDLVESLIGNSTFVPLYKENEVAAERSAAYSQGVTAGTNAVLNAPSSYGLYSSDAIMEMNLGGVMLIKDGSSVIPSVQVQTTTDLATQPFTDNGPPVELPPVEMPDGKIFLRIRALGPQ